MPSVSTLVDINSDTFDRHIGRGYRYVDLTETDWPLDRETTAATPARQYSIVESAEMRESSQPRQQREQRDMLEESEIVRRSRIARVAVSTLEEEERQSEEEFRVAIDRFHDRYWQARQDAHDALSEVHAQRQQREAVLALRREQETAARVARPPKQHRVYLINCKSCDSFLTDRGMKAVLLLRPHITLYSTDAMPNCGPLYPINQHFDFNEPAIERTCNCLTQTLGCYGCGNAVGYHIVSPCHKCTSSVAKHQRNSNGHRTVLHCAEIKVRERRYIPGEPSVMAAKVHYTDPYKAKEQRRPLRSQLHHLRPPPVPLTTSVSSLRRNSLTSVDDLMMSEAGGNGEWQEEDNKETAYYQQTYADNIDSVLEPPNRRIQQNVPLPSLEEREKKTPRVMKRGDIVYWSDLVTGGERCEPVDSDEILAIPICSR